VTPDITEIVCTVGVALPPCTAEKTKGPLGLSVTVPVTVRVTGIDSGLLDAWEEVTAIEPWYTPGASPDWFVDTLSVAGVVPVSAVTVNQVSEEVVKGRLKPRSL